MSEQEMQDLFHEAMRQAEEIVVVDFPSAALCVNSNESNELDDTGLKILGNIQSKARGIIEICDRITGAVKARREPASNG